MNSAWKSLIAIGIISLIIVVGWEIFQISTGGRSEFSLTVNEMRSSRLFTNELEQKLINSRGYGSF
jgi:hypothetical protein